MASYTMELRNYIEMWTQDTDEMKRSDRIEMGRPKLFDFDYPIFDQNYKKVFETKFIQNFYMSEIGFETEGLFKFKLENWLNINMPYYNKLFESELIDFDPLVNVKFDKTKGKTNDKTQTQSSETDGSSTGTSHQTNSGTATENDFGRNLESDNPDTRLTITTNDGSGVVEYASKIDETTQNNSKTSSSTSDGNSTENTNVTSTANATVNEIEDVNENVTGKNSSQSFSKMLTEYRETFLRIEKDIFTEMRKELFMLVY